jgi:3-dehydroquinate synthase
MNRRLARPLLLITIVLVVPIALLAIRGESFATQLREWQTHPPAPQTLAALVVVILAADIVLPVPSGPISTLAGSHLGVALGTAASALGMTLGAVIAFAVARRFGAAPNENEKGNPFSRDPIGERSPSTAPTAEQAARRHGPWMLVLTRPLPIIAEAAVLIAGSLNMPWRIFLPPVVVSNVVISVTYAALGQYAAEHRWLPLAVAASMAIPLAIAIHLRRRA